MEALRNLRKLHALLNGNCNVYFCLKPAARQGLGEKLRRAGSRNFLHQHPAIIRIPVKILAFLSWPLIALRLCWRQYAAFGNIVRRESGRGGLKQFFGMLSLAWFECIHPRYYYQFRLFDPARRQKRGAYLFHRKNHGLFMALNNFASGERVNNKDKFARFCREHTLPVPRTLLVCERGKATIMQKEPWPDFVVKPVYGHMGRDIRFGDAGDDGNYRYHGQHFSPAGLRQQLAQESLTEPCLVQERLYNHPALATLSNDHLATIRMVSYLDEHGKPALLAAYLGLTYDAITISNAGRDFPVDMATGRILPRPLMPLNPEFAQEITEAYKPMAEHSVPLWQEAKALVCKAHQLLPDYFSLGWDIAITPDGPVILETNIGWDTNSLQYFNDLPLGNTHFARCALARLARLK